MPAQYNVSNRTLQRLPLYVNFLRSLPADTAYISSTKIASSLGLNPVQVRKDLAAVGAAGRPRVGYEVYPLSRHLSAYLNGGKQYPAVLVGLGNLGQSLAAHTGFADYGFHIQAVFDTSEALIGRKVTGHWVQDIQALIPICRKLQIPVGIITVPKEQAQKVCDQLIAGGVRVIWNFAPIRLKVPKRVTVQDEDIAASLALLTQQILHRSASQSGSVLSQGGKWHDRVF